MGFCLYNNVAVAAAHARALGAAQVAIVDYDVHHGNGTQHMFEADPHVLYVSTHQFPYYPGTGAADEIGRERGTRLHRQRAARSRRRRRGLPARLRARSSLPVLRQFEPDLIIVSAGFDAHERDPLGGMRLTTAAFARDDARSCAPWPKSAAAAASSSVTEGGYDLQALAASLDAVIEAHSEPINLADRLAVERDHLDTRSRCGRRGPARTRGILDL